MAHDLGITVWPIRLLFAFWLLVAPVLITVVTGIIAGYLIPHTGVLWGIVLGFPLGIVNIFWSYWLTGLWPKFYYSKFYQDRDAVGGYPGGSPLVVRGDGSGDSRDGIVDVCSWLAARPDNACDCPITNHLKTPAAPRGRRGVTVQRSRRPK